MPYGRVRDASHQSTHNSPRPRPPITIRPASISYPTATTPIWSGYPEEAPATVWGEVSLLACDPSKGGAGLLDLFAATDVDLVWLAGRSLMPEQR